MEERLCRCLVRFSQWLAAVALSTAVGVAVGQRLDDPAQEAALLHQADAVLADVKQLVTACPALRTAALDFMHAKATCSPGPYACIEEKIAQLREKVHRCERMLVHASLQRATAALLLAPLP